VELAQFFEGKKTFVMENMLRKKHHVLMEEIIRNRRNGITIRKIVKVT
jgi:hypothetical protein